MFIVFNVQWRPLDDEMQAIGSSIVTPFELCNQLYTGVLICPSVLSSKGVQCTFDKGVN